MSLQPLSQTELEQALDALNHSLNQPWRFEGGQLKKTFRFRDFVAAFGFMSRVALLAERANHHPDWCNGYNRVTIALSTHEAGGITEKDFALAREIEAVAAT